jgi:hypothetical protein
LLLDALLSDWSWRNLLEQEALGGWEVFCEVCALLKLMLPLRCSEKVIRYSKEA